MDEIHFLSRTQNWSLAFQRNRTRFGEWSRMVNFWFNGWRNNFVVKCKQRTSSGRWPLSDHSNEELCLEFHLMSLSTYNIGDR